METKVVASAVPLNSTVAPERNPVPVTVRVKPAPPATADPGVSRVMLGAAIVIVNGCEFDAPPPGAGFVTAIFAIPVAAASAAVKPACNVVLEIKVVGRALPFSRIVDVETNPVPVTVTVNAGLPCGTKGGLRLATVGSGLLTAKSTLPESPPPGGGLLTATLFTAVVAISAAVIGVCSSVAETNVVVRAVPLNCTTELGIKLLPFTVKVKPCDPANAELGLTDVTEGEGLVGVGVGTGGGVEPPPPPQPVIQVRSAKNSKIVVECRTDDLILANIDELSSMTFGTQANARTSCLLMLSSSADCLAMKVEKIT